MPTGAAEVAPAAMPDFSCTTCGKPFSVADATLAKFPGWTPKQCMSCKNANPKAGGATSARSGSKARSGAAMPALADDPNSGVFTDGAASPNPGPGGFGAVYVQDGTVIAEVTGHEPHTTNNRMELRALIAGYKLIPPGTKTVIYTDSELCVNTINQWAAGWQRNGWKKKNGEIKNLELVKELYAIATARPEVELKWIRGHNGQRWNEYADRLATSYRTRSD